MANAWKHPSETLGNAPTNRLSTCMFPVGNAIGKHWETLGSQSGNIPHSKEWGVSEDHIPDH